MTFRRVAAVSEIRPGAARVFDVGDREIAACNVNGELYAIDNVCFDIRNGKVTALPAFLPLDVFPVRVVGSEVEVDV